MTKKHPTWDLLAIAAQQNVRQKPISQKEQDIILAAEKLFSEKGHAKTSTAEIASAAKTTERTLFKYFPTKDKLVRHILIPLILKTVMPTQVERTLKLIRMDWETPKSFLRALYLHRLEMSLQIGEKMKFMLGEVLQDPKLQNSLSEYWQTNVYPEFRKVIVNFQKGGAINKNLDPDVLSRTLIVAIVGQVLLFSVFIPDKSTLALQQIDDVISILVDGIESRERRAPT